MKKGLLGGISAMALVLSAGVAQAEGQLSIYNWFEYIPQELLDKFATEYDVEVTMDTYDSNEAMLAALKAGKLGEYDVAVPGDYMVEIMIKEGLLESFVPGEIPNFDNIDEQWMNVPFDYGRAHSIPYQIGTTGFMVNRDDYDGDIDTLDMLFNPPQDVVGKINMFDSQGEVLALASMYLGIPQCSTDQDQLRELNAMLLDAKQNWASFGSDISKEVLVSGEAAVGMIYNGFGARARAENASLEYANPKEGIVLWMDNVVLLKDAPNRDNALNFMNFLLEPENAAALSDYARYRSGVIGAMELTGEDLRTAPELEAPAAGEFVQSCEEDVQVIYDTIWTNLKK